MNGKNILYVSKEDLMPTGAKSLLRAQKLVDIGCGICPMSYYKPRVHLCIEPCTQYAEIISNRYANEGGVIVIQDYADEALKRMADNSVDAVYMADVIEHIEKDVGLKILKECVRVARKQVAIFTPLGFMPQEYESGGHDAWGVDGTTKFQEHLSGWLPEDFGNDWEFIVCNDFHNMDVHGNVLEKPYGAFWAILNKEKIKESGKNKSYIFVGHEVPPFPSEIGAALHKAITNSTDVTAKIISTARLAPYGRQLQTNCTRLNIPSVFFHSSVFRSELKKSLWPWLRVSADTLHFLIKAWMLTAFNRDTLVDCTTNKIDKIVLTILAITSFKKPRKLRLNEDGNLEYGEEGSYTVLNKISEL